MGTGCLQAIKYGDSFFRNCPLLSKIGFSPRIHRGHGEAIFYFCFLWRYTALPYEGFIPFG